MRGSGWHAWVARCLTALVLLGSLGLAGGAEIAGARPEDRRELSRARHRLAQVRTLLAGAKADVRAAARALVVADQELAVAEQALRQATARYLAAYAAAHKATLEAQRAQLEADAQQAMIDRRARATYMTGPPALLVTLLADTQRLDSMLDQVKLVERLAQHDRRALQALVIARRIAELARLRARALAERARAEQRVVSARAGEARQVRALRAAARRALQAKVNRLQAQERSLRGRVNRVLQRIRAEEAIARARAAWRAGGRRMLVRGDDFGQGGGGPGTASYDLLTPTAKFLYSLVARTFNVHGIGGWRPFGSVPGSDHPRGRALDVMVAYPSGAGNRLGWRIAGWATANAGALDVTYVIFNGRIWTAGEGWHGYRHPRDGCGCNPTLRHDDHVHISVGS